MAIDPALEEPAEFNDNYISYGNHVGLQLNRLTHSIGGPQSGPPISAGALGILHLAIHDGCFAIKPDPNFETYLIRGGTPPYVLPVDTNATDAPQAVAGAAVRMLSRLYTQPSPTVAVTMTNQLNLLLNQDINDFPRLETLSGSYPFGAAGADAMLAGLIKPGEPAHGGWTAEGPKEGLYGFDDDPTHAVRLIPVDPNDPNGPKNPTRIYVAPFYGMTATRFAVQSEHVIANPSMGFVRNDQDEYDDALGDVRRMSAAHLWAYDGVNLIGTPPRLYNHILRVIAWDRKMDSTLDIDKNNAHFARLLALGNVAMTDAGIIRWREKYCFEFWCPLSGERDIVQAALPGLPFRTRHLRRRRLPDSAALLQGSSVDIKSNKEDNISFTFVCDELNGKSRDLREPYDPNRRIEDQVGTVCTRVERRFTSLWEAIWENAISRIWLGVHWRFDAFAAEDMLVPRSSGDPDPYKVLSDGSTAYKAPAEICYDAAAKRHDRAGVFPIGGVPLEIGIANDIFASKMRPTPPGQQPDGRHRCGTAGTVDVMMHEKRSSSEFEEV